MSNSMAGTHTSKSTNPGVWGWLLVYCLLMGVVVGQRHPQFGLACGLAGCLLFAVRWRFGPETGRVFVVGFSLGLLVEWGAYFSIGDLVFSGQLTPQAFHSVYPFTFLYEKIWPSLDLLNAQGQEFSSATALNNGLAAMGAGGLTSGLLAGAVSLLAWYRFGVRRFFERSISPPWQRMRQFVHTIGQRKSARLARWWGFGVVVATFIVATWWAPFGQTVAIAVAVVILALFTEIGWLNARASEPNP
jgi:hypothetical protein